MTLLSGTCFVDCTETVCSDVNAGIPRTVRNIIGRGAMISDVLGMKIIPVVSINGTFYQYNPGRYRKVCTRLLSAVVGALRNLLDTFYYGKKVNLDSVQITPSSNVFRAGADLRPEAAALDVVSSGNIHLRIIEFCRKIIPFLFRITFYFDGVLKGFAEATIGPHDIILYPDVFWYRSTYLTFARYDAVKILLLHDIIPLIMPEACHAVYVLSFKRSLAGALRHIDGILTISRSELASIQTVLSDNGLDGVKLLDYNYWGADFSSEQSVHGSVRPRVVKALSKLPTFIMVGTLEPRKNHALVLDAFDLFWQRGGNASLCFVGKISPLCMDLKARIERHDLLGNRLFLFQDISDAELAYSYENCAGVVFASRAEGFGLPLVEAMWYGRPILASDIPVFREIGGDYPKYFPPDDSERLVELINACLQHVNSDKNPRQWLSWDESVLNLFGKVAKMSETVMDQRQCR